MSVAADDLREALSHKKGHGNHISSVS